MSTILNQWLGFNFKKLVKHANYEKRRKLVEYNTELKYNTEKKKKENIKVTKDDQ